VNRSFGFVSAVLLGLFILVPVAAAADPYQADGRIVISVRGDVTFPADQRADSLVVVDGTATIEGDVKNVFVVNGTANFVGSTTDEIVAIASRVSLDDGSVVNGNLRLMNTTVSRAAGATVNGSMSEGLDWVSGALLIGPALFIAYLGFVLAAMVAALGLAALASRQVRATEMLLSREIGTAIVAGFGGLFAIILVAILAIVTIVGIPLGLGVLFGFLPLVAFVGYLVAAIWIGEWVVRQFGRGSQPERPYLAAIVGILVLSAISFVPLVGGLISFVGFGAVILLMWRTLRRSPSVGRTVVQPAAAPSAS
jgi:hypothetical protein